MVGLTVHFNLAEHTRIALVSQVRGSPRLWRHSLVLTQLLLQWHTDPRVPTLVHNEDKIWKEAYEL